MWLGIIAAFDFLVARTLYQYRSNHKFYVNDLLILFVILCHGITGIIYQVAMPLMYQMELVEAGLRDIPADFVENVNLFLQFQFTLSILLWTTTWSVKFSLLSFFWLLFRLGTDTYEDLLVGNVLFHGSDVFEQCCATMFLLRSYRGLLHNW